MERLPHSELAPRAIPPEPTESAPRPRRPLPARIHALLLGLTFLTAGVAGGLFWEGGAVELSSPGGLLSPAVLWRSLLAGTVYAGWMLAILGAHEMGHYLACRYYGIPATLPFFLPGPPPIGSFGAVIRIRGPIPHRRALFDVAAAGPIAGFAVTVPVLIVGMLRAEPFSPVAEAAGGAAYLGRPVLMVVFDWLMAQDVDVEVNSLIGAGWVGLLVTSLNLFPVGQLDGGHAAYAISRRVHRGLTRATLVALAAVILAQLVLYRQFPFYVVWFAILLWMRDRHPRLLDERTPLGPGRKIIAALLLVIFALSFVFIPFYFA